MGGGTEAVQDYLTKHEGHRAVRYHVAKTGNSVMVFLDCLGCGAGYGTAMSTEEVEAVTWPAWAKAR